MGERQVTIKDIARKLNISPSTVSRALRDLADVKPETKQAVQKLAEELHYQPNTIALGLVNRRTYNIGVIVPDFKIHFYASALGGINKIARNKGYNVMVTQTNESYRSEVKAIQALISSQVDGLIIAFSKETEDFEHIKKVQGRKIPLVIFNRVSEEIQASTVTIDDYEGGMKATEHLINKGCRNIFHVAGPENLLISKERLRGYKDALAKAGLPFDASRVSRCDFTMSGGKEAMQEILKNNKDIDGLFAVSDAAAYGAMSVLKQKQLKIPEDVAVIGFTDEPFSTLIEPSLSTITQPSYEMGESVTKMLIEQIETKVDTRETVVYETNLSERDSSKILRS